MKTPFATFSEMLNLPRQEAARLSALISSDTFDKLVDESERVELRERADMVVQIEKLTEQRDNDHAPYKKFIKAQQDLEAAQARHKEMMGAVMAAHCELQRVGYGYESQINMLEQTLQRGSDPRLKQLVFVLDQQQNPVRRAFAARPQYEMTWGVVSTQYKATPRPWALRSPRFAIA